MKFYKGEKSKFSKANKDFSNHGLEEYRKYYYGEDGKLAKRNDSPQNTSRKIKFGQPKNGFQEGPLEDYLFTRIQEIKLEINKTKT